MPLIASQLEVEAVPRALCCTAYDLRRCVGLKHARDLYIVIGIWPILRVLALCHLGLSCASGFAPPEENRCASTNYHANSGSSADADLRTR